MIQCTPFRGFDQTTPGYGPAGRHRTVFQARLREISLDLGDLIVVYGIGEDFSKMEKL